MKELDIKVNDKNVRIHIWGENNKDTIVFLHGLGGSSLSCIELADKLKNNYKIISIDLPGHGNTDILEKIDFEVPNLIDWLKVIITKLVDGKHHIIAHSWGAELSLHYIAKHPHSVDKVVLLDGGYHDKKITNEYFTDLNQSDSSRHRISSMSEEIDYYVNDFDGFKFSTLKEAIEAEFQYYKRQTPSLKKALEYLIRFDGTSYRWHATGNTATNAILSMYKNPSNEIYPLLKDNILLLHCSLDIPGEWTTLRNKLISNFKSKTNVKTQMIENSGHMIHYDNPDDVIKYTLQFFN